VSEACIGEKLARLVVVVVMDQDSPRQHAEGTFDDAHVLIEHKVVDIRAIEERADG
jgi:hypothetical protein